MMICNRNNRGNMGRIILQKSNRRPVKIQKSSFEGNGIITITSENLPPGTLVDYEIIVRLHDAEKLVQETTK
jgi:hypothetical protein